MPVCFTRGAVIAHRYTYAPPHCRTSQYHMTFISLSVSLWNDLGDLVFDGVGLEDFKCRVNDFLLANSCSLHFSLLVSPCDSLSLFHSMG